MNNRPTYAVIGTDTDVGKTVVTCGLARSFAAMGYMTRAIKPVETGCDPTTPDRQDGVLLAQATGQASPVRALRRFSTPVAPPVAADIDGQSLDYGPLLDEVRQSMSNDHINLIEGAGGLLSPLTWSATMINICQDLSAHAILVAADKLGMINHTLMTISMLKHANIPLSAIVVSQTTHGDRSLSGHGLHGTTDESVGRNVDTMMRLVADCDITYLPYLNEPDQAHESLGDLAKRLVTRGGVLG